MIAILILLILFVMVGLFMALQAFMSATWAAASVLGFVSLVLIVGVAKPDLGERMLDKSIERMEKRR